MNELEIALKWLALGQRVFAAGAGAWAQIKGVLAANGIDADLDALDAIIADAERRKQIAVQDAAGGSTGD